MHNLEEDLASSIRQIIDEETQDANMYSHIDDSGDDFDFDNDEDEDEEYVADDLFMRRSGNKKPDANKNNNMVTYICIAIVVIVFVTLIIALVFIVKSKTQNSYTYNYDKGIEYYNDKAYNDAVISFNDALSVINDKDTEAIKEINMYLYDCYAALGQPNGQIEVLNNILDIDKYNADAIKKLATLYYEMGNGVEINRMIAAYKNTSSYSCVSAYAVPTPILSYGNGSYDSNISVSIICDVEGATIYYTLDGSDPTVYASQYEGPIEVGSGTTELKAMAISPIGVKSDVVSAEYEITYGKPGKPILDQISGTYKTDTTLKITNIPDEATAYYTWDGSVPTETSEKYDPEKGIEMLPGNNVLSVIIISKYGLSSSVAKYMYTLNLESEYDYTAAYDSIVAKLKETGVLKSETQLTGGEECRFVYYSMVKIEDKYIYLIYFDILKGGEYVRQDYYYGVDSNTLDLYKVNKDGNKNYTLSPL